jgi:hypothetical protein
MLVQSLRADLGMMISASHNPYYDNGVKFFTSSGHKISSELEDKIEQLMKTELSEYVAGYDDLGKAVKLEDARGRYIEHVKYSFPGKLKLDGIKIVVDCANGAAWDIAPKVFHELGAEVISCGISPNGFNINQECGVMDPQVLASEVLKHKADLGIALDGDADRVLIVDENGNPVYNSRENVTGVKEDFVEDKSRFTYEFNSPRSVQMDGVADPNDFKNGNGRTLQEVYDKSFVDYKDMIPNKSKREIEADQMNTQEGGSNLSFISPDTWIYEQEKPENGGIIANGLTAFDPLSFNSTANTLAVIDYKN